MTVKFLTKLIEPMTHPQSGKKVFELSHWHYSSELPYMALRTHIGFYEDEERAESADIKQQLIERFSEK